MERSLSLKIKLFEQGHWWFVSRRKMVQLTLKRYSQYFSGRIILDIGCGTGGMFSVLSQFGKVVGVDISQESVKWCRKNGYLVVWKSLFSKNLSKSFNICTAFDVLEHIDKDNEAIKQIHSLLVSKGLFICTVPAFSKLWSAHDDINCHYRRYTKPMLENKLKNNGFEIIFSRYFFASLFLTALVLRRFRKGRKEDNLSLPVKTINKIFKLLGFIDVFASYYFPFPFGTSLICVARKK